VVLVHDAGRKPSLHQKDLSDVGLLDTLAAGQASIEHLDGYLEALAGDLVIPPRDPQRPPPSDVSMFQVAEPAILDAVDQKKIPQLVAATRRAGAVVVPTLREYRCSSATAIPAGPVNSASMPRATAATCSPTSPRGSPSS
jgi:hypothetical protein